MQRHQHFAKQITKHQKVAEVRQKGVILAIDLNVEMQRYGNLRDKLFAFYMENGVFLRPLGNTIYILPPYVITDEQLGYVYEVIQASFDLI